jgi:PEP-CTERM motif
MRTRGRFVLFTLGLLIASVGRVESARAIILSDRLLITDATTGAILFDVVVSETGDFAPFFGTSPPNDLLGNTFVILLEPANEPAGENPILMPDGSGRIVSDLVVASFRNPNLPFGPGVILYSDGNPNLAGLVDSLAPILQNGNVTVLDETGDLQDLSALIGSDALGLKVQVQSDVAVPEPGTFALVGCGVLVLAARRRVTAR